MTTYSEKLRDPRWQRRRLEIMERGHFSCERCFDERSTLNVHHKRYFKGRDPWDYEDRWLVLLCEKCHKQEHEARDRIEELLALVKPVWMDWDELIAVVSAFVVIGSRMSQAEVCALLVAQEPGPRRLMFEVLKTIDAVHEQLESLARKVA